MEFQNKQISIARILSFQLPLFHNFQISLFCKTLLFSGHFCANAVDNSWFCHGWWSVTEGKMRFFSNYTFRLSLTRSSCKKNVMPTSIIPCHNMVSDASSHSMMQTITCKYLVEAAFLWISKKLISRMTQERHSLCKC